MQLYLCVPLSALSQDEVQAFSNQSQKIKSILQLKLPCLRSFDPENQLDDQDDRLAEHSDEEKQSQIEEKQSPIDRTSIEGVSSEVGMPCSPEQKLAWKESHFHNKLSNIVIPAIKRFFERHRACGLKDLSCFKSIKQR